MNKYLVDPEIRKKGAVIYTTGRISNLSPRDFYNWEDKGLIIPQDTLNPLSALHPSQALGRAHIIYCAKIKKYVCWIKFMGLSQFMIVIKIPGKRDLYIALADRWMPACDPALIEKVNVSIAKLGKTLKMKERSFEDVVVTDRRQATRTRKGTASDATSDARYVWLPIKWDRGVPRIDWQDECKLEDFS